MQFSISSLKDKVAELEATTNVLEKLVVVY
jgi:hypothetical protein